MVCNGAADIKTVDDATHEAAIVHVQEHQAEVQAHLAVEDRLWLL